MKMTDNSNKTKGVNKKAIIAGGCAGLVCIFAIIMVVRSFGNGNNEGDSVDDQQVVENEQSVDETIDIQDSIQDDGAENAIQQTDESFVDEHSIISFDIDDGLDVDNASILLKSTVVVYLLQIQNDLMDESDENMVIRDTIFVPLINAIRYGGVDMESKLHQVGVSVLNGQNPDVDKWTYNQYAGAVGRYLFYVDEFVGLDWLDVSQEWKLLNGFVRHGVFDMDIEKFENFELVPQQEELYYLDTGFVVNYVLGFKYDGQKWNALIGNKDHLFRVLDVLEESESWVVEDEKPVEESKQVTQSNGNGGTTNSDITDGVKVGDDYIFDDGVRETLPGFEGYEGHKDGYAWVVGVGYVPETERGGPIDPDNPAPDPNGDLGPIIGH